MTPWIASTVGLLLLFLCVISAALCQTPSTTQPAAAPTPELQGKSVFDLRCANCHGLDGLGGEHAPDLVRRAEVTALSDQVLLDVIHDGIPEVGMPGFSDMSSENRRAVVAYLRFLQGNRAGTFRRGDPVRGKDLFFGKAGCSACHQIGEPGKFAAGDLMGFARDHQVDEIREAIVRPVEVKKETATAVARDGRKFSGTIRNEDNASLQLQDGDGRLYLLMKSSLVSVDRKAADSMPVDYGHRLNTAELDDLVSYILDEARVPEPASSQSPSGKDEEPHVQD